VLAEVQIGKSLGNVSGRVGGVFEDEGMVGQAQGIGVMV